MLVCSLMDVGITRWLKGGIRQPLTSTLNNTFDIEFAMDTTQTATNWMNFGRIWIQGYAGDRGYQSERISSTSSYDTNITYILGGSVGNFNLPKKSLTIINLKSTSILVDGKTVSTFNKSFDYTKFQDIQFQSAYLYKEVIVKNEGIPVMDMVPFKGYQGIGVLDLVNLQVYISTATNSQIIETDNG